MGCHAPGSCRRLFASTTEREPNWGEGSAGIATPGGGEAAGIEDRYRLSPSCYMPSSTDDASHTGCIEAARPSRCPRFRRTHLTRNSDLGLCGHQPALAATWCRWPCCLRPHSSSPGRAVGEDEEAELGVQGWGQGQRRGWKRSSDGAGHPGSPRRGHRQFHREAHPGQGTLTSSVIWERGEDREGVSHPKLWSQRCRLLVSWPLWLGEVCP